MQCPAYRDVAPHIEPYYWHQVQCQLDVLDLEWCDFVKFRPATARAEAEMAVLAVRRDRAWRRDCVPRLDAFWRAVLAYRAATPDWRTDEHRRACEGRVKKRKTATAGAINLDAYFE